MFITANIVTFCGSVEEGRKKELKANATDLRDIFHKTYLFFTVPYKIIRYFHFLNVF